jgi:photosystem II stability/assembly factor-like uncharacterized protein
MDAYSHHSFAVTGCLIALCLALTSCQGKDSQSRARSGTNNENAWQIIGPGAGGGVFIPTISPFDPHVVFCKGDMTGVFVTYNGGKQWNIFSLMAVAQDFKFDPSDANVVYAASRGYQYDQDRGSGLTMLYRSDDRGKTWKVIYPDPQRIRPLERLQSMSFLPSQLVQGMPDGSIDKIQIDPADHNRIYLGLSPLRPYIGKLPDTTAHMTFLVATENRGKDWKKIADVPGTGVLGIFPYSTPKADEVTVVTDEACVIVSRHTGRVRTLSHPEGKMTAVSGGGGASGKTLLYLISEMRRDNKGNSSGGIYLSSDGGANWKSINSDLFGSFPADQPHVLHAVGVCGTRPEVAYVSMVSTTRGADGKMHGRYEIYKTINAGQNWSPVYSATDQEVLSKNFSGSWLNRVYGPGWGGDVLTLGVAPTDPDICYATDYGQMYKTTDGGKTWNDVCSENHPDGSVSSAGLDLTGCYGIAFDPFDKSHLIISYIDIGLFHSFDGGKSWRHLVEGIPAKWVNTCYSIRFDPTVKGRAWSTWANKHSLPRQSQFGDGAFSGYQGGVAVSDDGGRTWKTSANGLPENSISTDLLIDPSSNPNARTLYLATFNQGVFRSTDGGKSWSPASAGLKDSRYVWELRSAGKHVYALCVRGWRGETSIDGKLYYSDNQAQSWTEAMLPAGVTAPSDLLVDPKDAGHMYLSCWPKHQNGTDICGGVYETTDGGKSWTQRFDQRVRVFAAAFDPADSRKVFINTFQNAAYRSDDSGRTWTRIPGYRAKWGHCPIPDPNNPGMLYLTTYCVSAVYGPAQGTPEEFGRIVNIPESWW